jgi:response regulator RpfG family c-di-GMP phosphodiesterase
MVEKSLAVLIAARVDDILVLRRLLRDSAYRVDPATSATAALRALTQHRYHAVVADDDALVGISGAMLLSSVEELQPAARRVLVATRERRPQLANQALAGRFVLFVRPYFAAPVRDALLAHERSTVASGPRRRESSAKQAGVATGAAISEPDAIEDDTKPYAIASGGAVARRRLLSTMAELAESASGSSSGHAARVAALAQSLGRSIGLQPPDLDALDEAALLHDVGELGCPLRELQRHPQRSESIAERCGLGKPALAAVRHHHERWDGRGFPEGLARSSIPVLARILAVADTWELLAAAKQNRVRSLRMAAGSQLDPALVELFLSKKLYEIAQPATLRNAAMV